MTAEHGNLVMHVFSFPDISCGCLEVTSSFASSSLLQVAVAKIVSETRLTSLTGDYGEIGRLSCQNDMFLKVLCEVCGFNKSSKLN